MKKSRKSKIVLLSVLGLATVSLATVGFASWVISSVTPATSNNITANVGQIEDKTLTASIDSTSDLGVRFDNLESGTVMGNGDKQKEDLSFRIDTTITTTGPTLKGVLTSVKYEFTLGDFLKNAINKKYITFESAAVVTNITVSDTSASATNGFEVVFTNVKSVTVKGTFSFGWGEAFNNDNPGLLDPSGKIEINSEKTNLQVLEEFVNSFNSTSKELLTVKVTPNGTFNV